MCRCVCNRKKKKISSEYRQRDKAPVVVKVRKIPSRYKTLTGVLRVKEIMIYEGE